MRERPILFSSEMVKAILEGRKSQTRRVIALNDVQGRNAIGFTDYNHINGTWCIEGKSMEIGSVRCPYGKVGDKLWVRETLQRDSLRGSWRYDADGRQVRCSPEDAPDICPSGSMVCPSIHMPRWASRITLEITEVRVERLNSISDRDAVDEGCPQTIKKCECVTCPSCGDGCLEGVTRPKDNFKALWDSINGKKHPWSSNPWVWVISFRRVDSPTPLSAEPPSEAPIEVAPKSPEGSTGEHRGEEGPSGS